MSKVMSKPMVTERVIGPAECARRRYYVPICQPVRAPHPQDRIDRWAGRAGSVVVIAAGVAGLAMLGGFA